MGSSGKHGSIGWRSFEVAVAPTKCSTPTGMRDETILLAWLIVLMRETESSQIRFEWTYQGSAEEFTNVRSLSPNDVMVGLHGHVGQISAKLACRVPTIPAVSQNNSLDRCSLLLSTSSLAGPGIEVSRLPSLRKLCVSLC